MGLRNQFITFVPGGSPTAASGNKVVLNPTQLSVAIAGKPLYAIQDGLRAAGQASLLTSAATWTAPPTITGLSVSTGTGAGGTSITITGTGFTGASLLMFGAVSQPTFTVASPTSITTTSPAGLVGAVDIIVTNAGGASPAVAADRFTYTAPSPPTSLAATAGNASAALTWVTAANDATFNVYRSTVSSTGPWTLFTNTASTSSTVTGLSNGTLTYFTVTGVDTQGNESTKPTAVSTTPSAAPAYPASLIFYAPANEGTGTNVANVISGTNGTFSGSGCSWTSSMPANNQLTNETASIVLDGTAGVVTFTPSAAMQAIGSLSAFAISLRFKTSSSPSGELFSKNGAGLAAGWTFMTIGSGSGGLWFYVRDNSGNNNRVMTGSSTWRDGNWHYLYADATISAGNVLTANLYIDGSNAGQTTGTSGGNVSAAAISNSNSIRIGLGGGGVYQPETIGGLRFYNRQLTGTEITNLANGLNEDGTTHY